MPSERPARTSSAVAVGLALIATATLVEGGPARTAVGVEAVGLLIAGVGTACRARGWTVTGVLATILGVGVVLAALAFAASGIEDVSVLFVVVPALLGTFVLALALLPIRNGGSRWLVKAGTACLFVGVLLSGVFQLASPTRFLVCGAMVVVAWDAGENAISVGEQLGTEAATGRIEAVHVLGSVLVAGVAVVAARLSTGTVALGSSLETVVLLLTALLLFTVSLHD